MTQINDKDLRQFAREAKQNGIKNKSSFITWFRTVKKKSASMDRLHTAWKLCESDLDISTQSIQQSKTVTSPACKNEKLSSLAAVGGGLQMRNADGSLIVPQSSSELEVLNDYLKNHVHGIFHLRKGDNISQVMNQANVADKSGVYIISAIQSTKKKIIYVGKAGSMNTDGTMKSQGIRGRLKNVGTDNISRNIIFQQVIQENNYDMLEILWIITFDEFHKDLPAYIETKLLQAYYERTGHLPNMNKSI